MSSQKVTVFLTSHAGQSGHFRITVRVFPSTFEPPAFLLKNSTSTTVVTPYNLFEEAQQESHWSLGKS